MKTISPKYCTAILATLIFTSMTPALRADFEISTAVTIHSESDFYEPLAADGTWVDVEKHGRCWRPKNVAADWQPYTAGQWVWTDVGWFWESKESFGWAAYHYGRWHNHPTHHWVWVPGREWAPAWVAWRSGGAYLGWAPLPPAGVAVAGPSFVFVQTSRFTQPIDRSTVVVNDTTIISQTTVISNMRTENRSVAGATAQKVYVNIGPGLEVVQKATGQTIQAQPIQEVARRTMPAEFVRARAGQPDSRQNVNAGGTNAPPPTAPAGTSNQFNQSPGTFTQPTNPATPPGANQPPTSPPATAPAGSPTATNVQPPRVLTPEEQRALLPPEERRRVVPTQRTNAPVPGLPGIGRPYQIPPSSPPGQGTTPPPTQPTPPENTPPPATPPPAPTAPPELPPASPN